MTETEIVLIDTNLLVYNFDVTDPTKHKVARQLLNKCWKREKRYAISSQNLSEFFSVTTKRKLLSKREATEILSKLVEFSGLTKLNFTQNTVLLAARMSEENAISFWDALIAATMLENSVFTIYTENEKDFSKIKNLQVVNPFKHQ